MLALWHVAAGLPVGEFPQETQELLTKNGYTGSKVNRVAIVGNHFSPAGVTKDDGTQINTIWGRTSLAARRSRSVRARGQGRRRPHHTG